MQFVVKILFVIGLIGVLSIVRADPAEDIERQNIHGSAWQWDIPTFQDILNAASAETVSHVGVFENAPEKLSEADLVKQYLDSQNKAEPNGEVDANENSAMETSSAEFLVDDSNSDDDLSPQASEAMIDESDPETSLKSQTSEELNENNSEDSSTSQAAERSLSLKLKLKLKGESEEEDEEGGSEEGGDEGGESGEKLKMKLAKLKSKVGIRRSRIRAYPATTLFKKCDQADSALHEQCEARHQKAMKLLHNQSMDLLHAKLILTGNQAEAVEKLLQRLQTPFVLSVLKDHPTIKQRVDVLTDLAKNLQTRLRAKFSELLGNLELLERAEVKFHSSPRRVTGPSVRIGPIRYALGRMIQRRLTN